MIDSNLLKEVATNPKVIEAIFGNDVFNLENVCMCKTEINYQDSSIYVHIELSDFPSNPPKKWVLQKFNTAQLVLRIFDIQEFSSKGFFEPEMHVKVMLIQKEGLINFSIVEENELLYFNIKAKWLYIDRIEGYQAE
jgi:hypothetical protein